MIKLRILLTIIILSGFHINVQSIVFSPPYFNVGFKENINPAVRRSSFPFLSGDTFRSLANFYIDEFRIPFDTDKMKDGDIIFLRNYWMQYFFTEVHPHITCKYILISNNSIWPSPGKFAHVLDDEKIIAWFAQNVDLPYDHPKLFHIPVGIANAQWKHGNTKVLESLIKQVANLPKSKLLYINFATDTNTKERKEAAKYFAGKSFCYHAPRKPWDKYMIDLAESKFVVSPLGRGLDCHRTWEALLMGSIPVVKTSTLDKLYEDLPVIIVKRWDEITEEFLHQKWNEMKKKTYNMEKIYAPWWFNLIKSFQKRTVH